MVDNEIAILMAAGLGSRMLPITETIAKPLVKVNGTPLIETVIAALQNRGVTCIYIVTGYKAEQFDHLEKKYTSVHLVHNAEYAFKNNISSVAAVADKMAEANCFVCEADLFVQNTRLLCREITRSGYFGRKVSGWSDDWVFDADSSGLITRVGKGGADRFNMVGLSWFQKNDAQKIADAVRSAVNVPGNENLFWDEIVNRLVKSRSLDLVVHPVGDGEIVECDTTEDLKALEAWLD